MTLTYEKRMLRFGTPAFEEAPSIVVGRNEFTHRFWEQLRAGSVRLLAERRNGKTWILRLAIAQRPEWAVACLFNAENIRSTSEFVLELNKELQRSGLISQSWLDRIIAFFRNLGFRTQGQKINKSDIPKLYEWGELLNDTFAELCKRHSDKIAVVMIDELPFLLDNMIKDGRAREASELLDKLRAIRQSYPSVRMVFCGSLGLHIVLNQLRAQIGYTGQPTNNMPPVEVPVLDPIEAQLLAGGLLLGEEISCTQLDETAKAIALASSGVPFYIQHLINWMKQQPQSSWTPQDIPNALQSLLGAADNPAEFAYYNLRLEQYYPSGTVQKARLVLDILSRHSEPVLFNDLLNLTQYDPKADLLDSSSLLNILDLLRSDYYLVSTKDHYWSFKLSIVRQWWYQERGQLNL